MKNPTIMLTGPDVAWEARELLKKKSAHVINIPAYSSSDVLIGALKNQKVDAMIIRTGKITEEVIAATPDLKVIAKHGIGIDNIDIAAATQRHIPVLITPDAIVDAVAEYAVGMMFALAKGLIYLDDQLRQGIWEKSFLPDGLSGKCLGLIGIGRIARRVVELVNPLNMRVIAYDSYVPVSDFPSGVTKVETLPELLSRADIVSIHCPHTPETTNLLDVDELKCMKQTALVINTARGSIINETALITALRDHWIAGAALDTFSAEPISADNGLLQLPNVIVTPHAAGMTKESFRKTGIDAVTHVFQMLEGTEVAKESIINYKDLQKYG